MARASSQEIISTFGSPPLPLEPRGCCSVSLPKSRLNKSMIDMIRLSMILPGFFRNIAVSLGTILGYAGPEGVHGLHGRFSPAYQTRRCCRARAAEGDKSPPLALLESPFHSPHGAKEQAPGLGKE